MSLHDTTQDPQASGSDPSGTVIVMEAPSAEEWLATHPITPEHADPTALVASTVTAPAPTEEPLTFCPRHKKLIGDYLDAGAWRKLAIWLPRLVGPRPNPAHIDELMGVALRWSATVAFCDACTSESIIAITPSDGVEPGGDTAELPLAA